MPDNLGTVFDNVESVIQQVDCILVGEQLQDRNVCLLLVVLFHTDEWPVRVASTCCSVLEMLGRSLEDRSRYPAMRRKQLISVLAPSSVRIGSYSGLTLIIASATAANTL